MLEAVNLFSRYIKQKHCMKIKATYNVYSWLLNVIFDIITDKKILRIL